MVQGVEFDDLLRFMTMVVFGVSQIVDVSEELVCMVGRGEMPSPARSEK